MICELLMTHANREHVSNCLLHNNYYHTSTNFLFFFFCFVVTVVVFVFILLFCLFVLLDVKKGLICEKLCLQHSRIVHKLGVVYIDGLLSRIFSMEQNKNISALENDLSHYSRLLQAFVLAAVK